MSYLVLARKYRPQTFEEVVGQKPVVKTLQNSIKRHRVAHAILFSGVRGVGKTTLARLMAKALNCEAGPSPVPCNKCDSCIQIMAGSAFDLHEIDGASNRGIQEVRELKDKIKYLPTSSRYKIIIIDEVHMLTTEAFNALLKTLEEPPEHVYFIFATTELHKIPITILSRCQRFELQRVGSEELATLFTRLAQTENVTLEKGALSLIVREAEGSVRDGLSLLDQVLSYGDSPISSADVVEVLGLVDRDVLFAITAALLCGDRASALDRLADTFRFGMDIKRFLSDLLECFRNLMLIRIGGCKQLLDLPEDEKFTYQKLAEGYPVETIHQKLNLLMQAADAIRHSFQPRLTLESAFFSIIESGNVVTVEDLLTKLDSAITALSNDPSSEETASAVPPPSAIVPDHQLQAEPDPPGTEKKTVSLTVPDTKPDRSLTTQRQPSTATDLEPPVSEESPEQLQPADDVPPPENEFPPAEEGEQPRQRHIRKDWIEFVSYVKDKKEWMAQNLQQTTAVKQRGQDLFLEFDDPAECKLLRTRENRQILTGYVLNFFQKDYTIHVTSVDDSEDSDPNGSEGPKKRRQQLASNPLVRMTEEIFNGQAGSIRIGPLS